MLAKIRNLLRPSVSLALVVGLTACFGGSHSHNSTPGTASIDGYVPSQAYTVQAKDAAGNPVTSAIPDAQGKYSLNVTGKTGPFLVEATPPLISATTTAPVGKTIKPATNNSSAVLFSWVDAFKAPASGKSVSLPANINTLTTWAIEALTGKDNATLQGVVPGTLTVSQSTLNTALQNLLQYSLPASVSTALQGKGINPQSDNLFNVTNGNDLVAVLAQQQIGFDGAGNLTAPVTVNNQTISVTIPQNAVHKPVSIAIQAQSNSLVALTAEVLTVRETFDDNSTATLPAAWLTWTASNGASVDASTGNLTVGTLDTTVTATHQTAKDGQGNLLTASTSFTVTPAVLNGLTIVNVPVSAIAPDSSVTLSANASFNNNTSQNGVAAAWSVDNTAVASIDSTGKLTALHPAQATQVVVTASFTVNGVTEKATASVSLQQYVNYIVSATISGGSNAPSGVSDAYQLSITYRNGDTATLNADSWTLSNASINGIAIDSNGNLTSPILLQSATVTIAATLTDPATNSAIVVPSLPVTLLPYVAKSVTAVTIIGVTQVGNGQSVSYIVDANLDGTVLDVSSVATLTSDTPAVLSVSGMTATGTNATNAALTANLTASYGGVSSTPVLVTVLPTPPKLNALVINSLPTVLSASGAVALTATASWSDGTHSTVAAADGVVFTSDNTAAAQVSNGILTAASTLSAAQAVNVGASLTDPNDGTNTVQALPVAITVDPLSATDYLNQGVDYLNVSTSLQYDHNHVQAVSGQNTFINGDIYNYANSAFTEQVPNRADRILIDPVNHVWTTVTGPWLYTANADGSVSFSNGWDGSLNNLSYTSVDVSGQPISNYVPASMISGINLAVKSGAVFSSGAKFITAYFTQKSDGYVLFGTTGATPADLTAVVSNSSTSYSVNGSTVQFVSTNADNTSGFATVLTGLTQSVGVQWTRETVNGVEVVVLNDSVFGNNEHLMLSMYNGALWWGMHSVAPFTWGNPGKDVVFNDVAINDLASNLQTQVSGGGTLPPSTTSVPAGDIRVHWQYTGDYTESGGWGVYSWQGPLTVNTAWPGGRILFTNVDSYGALVDIPVDTTQTTMQFLIINGTGDASKFANCASNMSASIPANIATQGEEIWLNYGSCTVSYTAPI